MSRKTLPQKNSFHETHQNSNIDKVARSIYIIQPLIFIVMDFKRPLKISMKIKQRSSCTLNIDEIQGIVSDCLARMRKTENTASAAPSMTIILKIFCCYHHK